MEPAPSGTRRHTPRIPRIRRWMGGTLAVLAAGAVIVAIVWFDGTRSGPFPQIIGQNCGEVSYVAGARASWDPDEAELCLLQAYRTCRKATLVFAQPALDFGSALSAITVQPQGGGCGLTDARQGNCSRAGCSVTSYHCASLQPQNGGALLRGCGTGGDIYLPPRPADEVGHVCGAVINDGRYVYANPYADPPATVAGIEDCFWRAYSRCAPPMTLVYQAGDDHTLVVQEQHGTCVLTDAVQSVGAVDGIHRCTGMARLSGGGLAVRGCAVEGDFTIPPGTPENQLVALTDTPPTCLGLSGPARLARRKRCPKYMLPRA